MSLFSTQNPYPFFNNADETVPPGGLIACSELTIPTALNRPVLRAEKPISGTPLHQLYVNSIQDEVASRSYGQCVDGSVLTVAYDPADGIPQAGEEWGITDDFLLRSDGTGFEILLTPDPEDGEFAIVRKSVIGAAQVKFTISSFDEGTGIATCTIRYRDTVGKIPGQDDDGNIEVRDADGCYFNETEADLIGRKGDARWMIDDTNPNATPSWYVVSLCCGAAVM